MILIINIVVGIILAFFTSLLKKFRETVQSEIFCASLYLLEIIECISKRTVRIYSTNSFISIIIIILLPFIIFFIYHAVKGIIEPRMKNKNNQEE